jgi:hypothetical protein
MVWFTTYIIATIGKLFENATAPKPELHCRKTPSRSEGTNKGSLDVINEEKDESADDMMGLGFSLVGSFEHSGVR